MIFGRIEDFRADFLGGRFPRAFEFIRTLRPDIAKGRTDIAEGIYVNVMEYSADEPWQVSRLEAHRQYADIQIVLSGAECAACENIAKHRVDTPYSEADDVWFLKAAKNAASRIELRPGLFAVFFPEDGHYGKFAPSSGACPIRKAVVKVRL